MERITVPTLSHARNRMQIVRIFRNGPFQQCGNDVERTDAVHNLWIEVLHFLAIALVPNLQARSAIDVRFAASTRYQRSDDSEANCNERDSIRNQRAQFFRCKMVMRPRRKSIVRG
jgi:hypothetical protein